jgi:ArsR family transcriptional regulator, arsenate/arsenite/antimonite-responsive transcriptional repressor
MHRSAIIAARFSEYANSFKALSDSFRLDILFFLMSNGEQCVCRLSEHFQISQSAISYHLKILFDNELLIKRQEAVWNMYSINTGHFLFPILEDLLTHQVKHPVANKAKKRK